MLSGAPPHGQKGAGSEDPSHTVRTAAPAFDPCQQPLVPYSELIGVTDGSTRMGEDTTHKEGPYGRRLLTLLAQSPDTSCESLCQLYSGSQVKKNAVERRYGGGSGCSLG